MATLITVTVTVDPALAALAGKTSVGEHQLTLTDEDLAQLTDEQRETLAAELTGSACDLSDPAVAEPTIAGLRYVLDVRRERKRQARIEADSTLAAMAAELEDATPETVQRYVDRSGDTVTWRTPVCVDYLVYDLPNVGCYSDAGEALELCSPEVAKRFTAAHERLVRLNEAAHEAAVEAAVPQWDAIEAEEQAKEQAGQREAPSTARIRGRLREQRRHRDRLRHHRLANR